MNNYLFHPDYDVLFYHASPVNGLKHIEPTKKSVHTNKKYACLAHTPAHAYYWAETLGRERKIATWYIYEVAVPRRQLVEDCNGHYHFEKEGIKCSAWRAYAGGQSLDSELLVFESVPVIRVHSIINLNLE